MSSQWLAIITVIATIYILLSSPFRCPIMAFSDEEIEACRKSIKIRIITLAGICVVCNVFDLKNMAIGISMGIALTACGLAIAYINPKRRDLYEETA